MKLKAQRKIFFQLGVYLCAFLCTVGHSQPRQQANGSGPVKVDEWGHFMCNDALARWDFFASKLKADPTARAYIIGYGDKHSPFGRIKRHLKYAQSYLTEMHAIDASRINVIDGGYREQLIVEYWIVPEGSAPPVATPTVRAEVEKSAARKFDEGLADYLLDRGRPVLSTFDLCSFSAPDLKEFADILRAEPELRGFIVVHPKTGARSGRTRVVKRLLKSEMVEKYKLDPSRIVIRDGRGRDIPLMELWTVPKGIPYPPGLRSGDGR